MTKTHSYSVQFKHISKYLLLTVVLCHISFLQLHAQNNKSVDSLFSILRTSGLHDTTRIIALNDLARKLMNVNPDTSILLSNQALQYSQSLFEQESNFSSAQYVRDKLQAVSYNNLGVFNWLKGNYPVAFDYYFKALTIRQSLNDKTGIASSLSNIGSIYWSQGNYSKALDYNFKAMLIAQEIGDKQFYANMLGNIGVIYASQKNHTKALECYFEVVKIKEAGRSKKDIINLYGNIGNAFVEQKKYIDAIHYYSKIVTLAGEEGNKVYMASTLVNLGETYTRLKNYPRALEYYFKALKLFEQINNQSGLAASLGNIGSIYSLTGKYKDAELYLQKAINISNTIGALEHIREFEKALSHVYEQTKQPAKAFDHYKKYTAAKDSLFNEENTQKIVQSEMNYEFEKKQAIEEAKYKSELEKQTAISEEKHRKQNIIIVSVVAGLLLVIGFAAFIFRTLHITRQQKQIIELKNKEIEEKNRDITASITYTKRIQRAMLPHRSDILAAFPQSFVLFKPKDIVSGDFYFFHNKKENNAIFLAAADCTGHGVPGAFMSMIGAEKLKEAVMQSNDTSEILTLLNKGIKASLRQSENSDSTRDGMDIALVRIDKPDSDSQPVTIYYAGANRPIWIIRKGQPIIEEIKATKKGIAGFTDDEQQYATHKFELQPNDAFYIFTDGYADLFGEAGKKLMIKRVKEILLRIQDKPMKEQGKFLESYASKWQGNKEQIDDILMIGIRV